jgi:hypothetical protein
MSAKYVDMKTVRLTSIALLLVFGASAFAETSVVQKTSGRRADRKLCYTIVGSGIPQPCDRFAGPIPTTASPIEIYGRRPR